VIYAEFGREDHGSIARNYNREELKPLDVRTNIQTRYNWWRKQNKIFLKKNLDTNMDE
jgi:hypothetical protein